MDERESIVLSYPHAFRLLLHLQNVIAASKQVSAEDELLKEVYRDSIVKKYENFGRKALEAVVANFQSVRPGIEQPEGMLSLGV
ncbi:hypothetical protein [Geobacillus kaustophilus]|uniref:hypothetical protein n=1 Tax=Geobacillus kaustophilus TaxID=1462 RepID=UPI000AE95231|nr:hypothetical protein [Geobacillus kaustophilus]